MEISKLIGWETTVGSIMVAWKSTPKSRKSWQGAREFWGRWVKLESALALPAAAQTMLGHNAHRKTLQPRPRRVVVDILLPTSLPLAAPTHWTQGLVLSVPLLIGQPPSPHMCKYARTHVHTLQSSPMHHKLEANNCTDIILLVSRKSSFQFICVL